MSDVDFGSFFVQLATAGNDTTKAMMSAGVYELMRHLDQVAALRGDLAWSSTPSRRCCATATRCTTSGGRPPPTPSWAASDPPATRWRWCTRRPTATSPCSPTLRSSTSAAA